MPRPVGRRAEILDTFVRHVAEYGYERTNLGDIADELGMSKGTIVHHFGTKAQLLRELEENYMSQQLDAVRALWQQFDRPDERVAALMYASALLQVVSRDATVATQREVVQLSDDPAMREVRKLRSEMQQMTVDEMLRGIDGNIFRPVDAEIATFQLWGSMQWMWVWFDAKGTRTPEEVGAVFVDVFLGGLLADRLNLAKLADPKGPVVAAVREALTAATTS
jgi:AcrR family transcriptional regulator